ncbi:HAMP domain-containing sensor histidine kinase [uncultured Serinicoccus sp.]|uniref:sensor histidine kinase n=1 Tax=uncultured Serinicoccus sp. TaxID=735514 RepID=UPI0026074392|nr:HAMP domain-containing sensor histidine kinase [uncultured Serinicoccus sp.]
MRPELEAITLAAGTAGAVGLAGAALTLLVARRSPAAATLLGPVVGVASVAAGVVVTTRAMFLSEHDATLIALVLLAAAPVALAIGALLFRSVRRLDRRAQQRLADEQRELALARSRQDMITWASHDLRTPLSSIRVMAEALEDGLVTDHDDYHRRIRAEADRMTVMVDDLLELSRLRSAAPADPGEVVDLADVAAAVVAGQQPVAEQQQVRVRLTGDGPAPVRAVAGELDRVVANVVSNAVRESAAGSEVVVHVGADPVAEEVVLHVDDACGGLGEEALAHAFEPGWRGSSARSAGAGVGVGLTIAHALVERSGGTITLADHGPGCRVRIALPRHTPAPDAR